MGCSLQKKIEQLKTDLGTTNCNPQYVLTLVSKELGVVVKRIKGDIEKRKELTEAKHSDNPITDHGRRSYWKGYIEAKEEDLKLLVEGDE